MTIQLDHMQAHDLKALIHGPGVIDIAINGAAYIDPLEYDDPDLHVADITMRLKGETRPLYGTHDIRELILYLQRRLKDVQ